MPRFFRYGWYQMRQGGKRGEKKGILVRWCSEGKLARERKKIGAGFVVRGRALALGVRKRMKTPFQGKKKKGGSGSDRASHR